MKYLITFSALVIATALNSLSWPVLTGIGITFFAGMFIFAINTAHNPIRWKVSPNLMEHIQNVAQLIAVLIIFFVTAVILVALADSGLSIMEVVKILVNV